MWGCLRSQVLNNIRGSPYGSLFNPENYYSDPEGGGAGNNVRIARCAVLTSSEWVADGQLWRVRSGLKGMPQENACMRT